MLSTTLDMLEIPDIDDETNALFCHLRGLAIEEEAENLDLIDDFARGIEFHKPSLYSFTDKKYLYNPVINNLIQHLLRVIPSSSQPYESLLEKVLAPLSFAEICKYISKDTILGFLTDPRAHRFTLQILKRKVRGGDEAAISFIADNDLIIRLTENVFAPQDEDSAYSTFIYDIIPYINQANPKIITADKFKFLTRYTSNQRITETFVVRYFMLLSALSFIDFSEQPWGIQLFFVNFHDILALDANMNKISCILLVVATYNAWIGKVSFSWLKPFIADLFEHVHSNHPQHMAKLDFMNDHLTAFQSTFVKLLNSNGESLDFALDFLSRPGVDIVDKKESTSLVLFSQINLANIPAKEDFFLKHFSDLNVRSGSQFATGCIRSLIRNKTFFNLLVEKNMLTDDKIEDWQKEHLFKFFKDMACFDYSAHYLLTALPDLVQSHLLTVDRTLLNNEIWDDKREALRLLLSERNVDLKHWKSGLSNCLYEMENGRRLTNPQPQVEIASETMY